MTQSIAESAYALGVGCQHAGLPREPHKIAEVERIFRNLEFGSPELAQALEGYLTGWDAAARGEA